MNPKDNSLKTFQEIANNCDNEKDLNRLIKECELNTDPFINTQVRKIYKNKLKKLQDRRFEVEHYEKKFGIFD